VYSRRINLRAACESDCTVHIGQFYYPAWRARLMPAAEEVPLKEARPSGLMELSLPPGNNNVELELPRDWSEQAGPWVSLTCLVLAVVIALIENRRQAIPVDVVVS
jgi:hypothetical protein